jgi:hypothetical protein
MMLPEGAGGAAPADVALDIRNETRAPFQLPGLQVMGVETVRTAAGLDKPVVQPPIPVPGGMETSCLICRKRDNAGVRFAQPLIQSLL